MPIHGNEDVKVMKGSFQHSMGPCSEAGYFIIDSLKDDGIASSVMIEDTFVKNEYPDHWIVNVDYYYVKKG